MRGKKGLSIVVRELIAALERRKHLAAELLEIDEALDQARKVLGIGALSKRQERPASDKPFTQNADDAEVDTDHDDVSTLLTIIETAKSIAQKNGHTLEDVQPRNGEWVSECIACGQMAVVEEIVNGPPVWSGRATERQCVK